MARRKGFLINAAVLVLIIPLLLLMAVYESTSTSIIHAQSKGVLLSRDRFAVSVVQQDLKNALYLSMKRAYLTLTDYVVAHGPLTNENASYALKSLIIDGKLNGQYQPSMENVTIEQWFNNFIHYISSLGMSVAPNNFEEVRSHLQITVAPLDSFHVAVKARLVNITIKDSSGGIVYSGNIPESGYVYAVVSVTGFEDPLIPSYMNGIYTRIVTPCVIPYPSQAYGYYNIKNVSDLVLGECYVGVNTTVTYNGTIVYYPTILNRFEEVNYATYVSRVQKYTLLAEEIQKALGMNKTLPVGLITFLVPSNTVDPALVGALTSLNLLTRKNYDSVGFYFLNCELQGGQYCLKASEVSLEYPAFRLDNTTKLLLFNKG